jgi:DNA-binding PadR family transcriptional regulator
MSISPLSKRVLMFLRQETFSTALNIQKLLAHQHVQATHQLLKRMCRDGLVHAADIYVLSGRPIKLYGITDKGIAYAWELTETVTSSMVFQPSKVSPLKSASRMRQILASHLAMRKAGHWQKIIYLCPSLDLARRLQRKFELLEYVTWRGARISLSKPHFEPFIFADYEFFNSKTRGHTL